MTNNIELYVGQHVVKQQIIQTEGRKTQYLACYLAATQTVPKSGSFSGIKRWHLFSKQAEMWKNERRWSPHSLEKQHL